MSSALRTRLLAGTAVSSSLLFGLPGAATAQFVVSGGTVTNTVTTTTKNNVNNNPNAGASSDATQQFNQPVIGNNTATGVIQGFGLQLTSNNSFVSMTNNGSINANTTLGTVDALLLTA